MRSKGLKEAQLDAGGAEVIRQRRRRRRDTENTSESAHLGRSTLRICALFFLFITAALPSSSSPLRHAGLQGSGEEVGTGIRKRAAQQRPELWLRRRSSESSPSPPRRSGQQCRRRGLPGSGERESREKISPDPRRHPSLLKLETRRFCVRTVRLPSSPGNLWGNFGPVSICALGRGGLNILFWGGKKKESPFKVARKSQRRCRSAGAMWLRRTPSWTPSSGNSTVKVRPVFSYLYNHDVSTLLITMH